MPVSSYPQQTAAESYQWPSATSGYYNCSYPGYNMNQAKVEMDQAAMAANMWASAFSAEYNTNPYYQHLSHLSDSKYLGHIAGRA